MNLALEPWSNSLRVPEEEIQPNTVSHTTSEQIPERYDSNAFSHFARVVFYFEYR